MATTPRRARRCVVLDRDGTINVERRYLSDPQDVELIRGVGDALRSLQELGLGLVVITNQSAVGRGFFDAARLDAIHRRLRELLAAEGVLLEGLYYCPHAPHDGCSCRKPQPGLVERAARELDFDPRLSFVIGDKTCDLALGQRVGATTFLVRTGYGAQVAAEGGRLADYVVDGLGEAVPVIERLLKKAPQFGLVTNAGEAP